MNDLINKIKILRTKTGLGLSLCKDALLKNNSDINKAIDYLKSNNKNVSLKNVITLNNNGSVYLLIDEGKKNGILIEISTETDFVSRSLDFLNSLKEISHIILQDEQIPKNHYIKNFNFFKNIKIDKILSDLNLKFKEKIFIKRIKKINIEYGFLIGYIHMTSDFGKYASIVHFDDFSKNYFELCSDLSKHVVAMNPIYLNIKDVPDVLIKKEKDNYLLKNPFLLKKDENIKKKILDNYIFKFFEKNVLYEQFFVKDNEIKIKNLIKNKFDILNFYRFELGEDIYSNFK